MLSCHTFTLPVDVTTTAEASSQSMRKQQTLSFLLVVVDDNDCGRGEVGGISETPFEDNDEDE